MTIWINFPAFSAFPHRRGYDLRHHRRRVCHEDAGLDHRPAFHHRLVDDRQGDLLHLRERVRLPHD